MYILVYGTLKKNYPNHYLLKNAEYICSTQTEEKYIMLDLGPFPGVIETIGFDGSGIAVSGIKGELYRIDSEIMKTLDELEKPFFARKMVDLACNIRAWMYFLEPDIYNNKYYIVTSGKWTK